MRLDIVQLCKCTALQMFSFANVQPDQQDDHRVLLLLSLLS